MSESKKVLAGLMIALGLATTSVAVAKGRLGFVTEVSVSGIFSPVLKRVKVASVTPGSPAAIAGMKAGDYIIEADGHAVEGSPAREMAARIKAIKPGERLRLKLMRGGEFIATEVVAAP